jgi:pimeloyl-ACP methyl ester carboxylesterase
VESAAQEDLKYIEPMHVFSGTGGVRLAGDSWGNPDAPLVILLHGGGQTRHAWKGAGERLAAAGFNALALDARGHGDSQWATDGCYDQDVMLEDLKCVVATLGGRRPALVGASLGGATSLVAAGEGQVNATALVLVDVAPRIERAGVAKIRAFMTQNPDGFETLQQVADAIASYQPQRARPNSLSGLAKNVRRGADGRYRWHWDPRFSGSSHYELEPRQRRLEMAARSLTLPTLLVRGGMSDVLTDDGVREFRALVPHAEYVNVTEAAHMVAGDQNDVFSNAVIHFLSQAVPVTPH